MILLSIFLIWLHIISVQMMGHHKPIAQMQWQGKCTINPRLLNDCNWCRCTKSAEYLCDARDCPAVDMFGHFNDVIKEHNLGMEGHGSWRSRQTACEPNVKYRRGGLLCVCTVDGQWPNPVCRDIFRILYPIEASIESEAAKKHCEPGKLYLIGCNACLCSGKGKISPKLCTSNHCANNDPVLKSDAEMTNTKDADEIYAECEPEINYKLECKDCVCLKNNRLVCSNCTDEAGSRTIKKSFCRYIKPGQLFSRDCNMCYCDKNNYAYCSTKKCLEPKEIGGDIKKSDELVETDEEFEEGNCSPAFIYKRDCNTCFCAHLNGKIVFVCTFHQCRRSDGITWNSLYKDCVEDTSYELNCLVCHCKEVNGVKTQYCEGNPLCREKISDESNTGSLASLHGYCEPLHIYKDDCNTCTCFSDGKTMKCTSYICDEKPLGPVSVEIVPVRQRGGSCPKGISYKVDCNYCFCLSNGNVLCTNIPCSKKE